MNFFARYKSTERVAEDSILRREILDGLYEYKRSSDEHSSSGIIRTKGS